MSIVLILTATINSNLYDNTGNVLTDIDQRKKQYYNSLENYIKNSIFEKIIFIENSNYNFDLQYFEILANANNKEFEFIKGTVCIEEIKKYGKSYGDAFLVHEAIKKSNLLKNEKSFYKISGRIFLKNSFKVIKKLQDDNAFIVYLHKKWCFTNIFKCSIEDYKKYFDDVYLDCNEKAGYDIEVCMFDRLVNSYIKVGRFHSYPIFIGRQGANNLPYTKGGLNYYSKNIFLKLNLLTYNSKMANKICKLFN